MPPSSASAAECCCASTAAATADAAMIPATTTVSVAGFCYSYHHGCITASTQTFQRSVLSALTVGGLEVPKEAP